MKTAVCSTCTIHLVELCYQKTWWFRWFREPLVLGMRTLYRCYRIDPYEYEVRTERCRGCVRFLKTALKEKSTLFRVLNIAINPLFNRVRDSIVTEADIGEARKIAGESG
ncbi:MAG: nitroreductase [Candidatus Latescibacterota bacterium]